MILDTYTLLFQSDTDPLEDGLNKSRQTTDELVDSIKRAESQVNQAASAMGQAGQAGAAGMNRTGAAAGAASVKVGSLADSLDNAGEEGRKAGVEGQTGLKKVEDQAGKADNKIRVLGASLVAMIGSFMAMGAVAASFSETVEELENVGRTADALGLPVEDVDAFGRAMQTMGGDAQGARDALTDMAESIGEAVADVESGRAKVYKTLGISLKDVNGQAVAATEGMLRLSDAVSGMSKQEAIFRIKELGITDNRTVEMVLKGRKEMERMLAVQKEQSGVTKESIENARRYTEALGAFRSSLGNAGQGLMQMFIPALTKMVEWLKVGVDWVVDNKQAVLAFIGAIATAVAAVFLPAMVSAAAATLAATWPLIAIGLAVAAVAAAFALAYDDVMNFIDGNDSLIGQIFDKFPGLKDAVMGFIDVVRLAWGGIREFAAGVLEALSPLVGAFGGVFSSIGNYVTTMLGVLGNAATAIARLLGVDIGGAFKGLGSTIGAVMDSIIAVIKYAVGIITSSLKLVSGAIDGISSAASTVAGWVGLGDSDEAKGEAPVTPDEPKSESSWWNPFSWGNKDADAGKKALNQANRSPLNSVSSGAISNSVATTNRETNVQVGEVTINTQATDAEGIAGGVAGSLQEQLAQVDAEFSTGRSR